ncbi:GNAT family N-acetyltransferase [Paenibacillus sinopodophylli]|uniref:GNAT family N-acetyltransferase n=1 Tax=Paenibacillus sinopodophylli TaxID=1837342 RepID=UPI00110C8DAD|nr:GNAT family N-acetyltransferase [Paenibacillus sinopodophylli]
MKIEPATTEYLHDICEVDYCVIGSRIREPQLAKAIAAQQCIVAIYDDVIIGFATFDQTFYEQSFIQLLIVNPSLRRRGAASALMKYIEQHCTTPKLFTSTNASNTPMQRVCESLGFIRSGTIENLDDGDPEWVYFKAIHTPIST